MKSGTKYFFLGIPVLFFAGSLFHFLYEWSGENPIVGAIAAVNESVWEHCKLIVLPLILWWVLGYLFLGKKYRLDIDKWFTAAAIALLTAIITVPLLFYGYTNAFGFESVIIDIFLLLVGLAVGQSLGYHYYRYGKGINYMVGLVIMLAVMAVFVLFTFKTPHLPIFMDKNTGRYGIE